MTSSALYLYLLIDVLTLLAHTGFLLSLRVCIGVEELGDRLRFVPRSTYTRDYYCCCRRSPLYYCLALLAVKRVLGWRLLCCTAPMAHRGAFVEKLLSIY